MQRLILGAIALLAWMPLAGQPQREDAAIQARIDETSARGGSADPERAFLDDTVFDGACKSLS